MSVCIVFFIGMFIVSSAIDGSEISSQMFREILRLAGADLLGLLLGGVCLSLSLPWLFSHMKGIFESPEMEEPTEENGR